jgi:hypothetical protein
VAGVLDPVFEDPLNDLFDRPDLILEREPIQGFQRGFIGKPGIEQFFQNRRSDLL